MMLPTGIGSSTPARTKRSREDNEGIKNDQLKKIKAPELQTSSAPPRLHRQEEPLLANPGLIFSNNGDLTIKNMTAHKTGEIILEYQSESEK